MSSAFKMAADIVQRWVAEHPKGFAPIVINITDGESTDGDPIPDAKALGSLGKRGRSTLPLQHPPVVVRRQSHRAARQRRGTCRTSSPSSFTRCPAP